MQNQREGIKKGTKSRYSVLGLVNTERYSYVGYRDRGICVSYEGKKALCVRM